AFAETLYAPMGSSVIRKFPLALVVAERDRFVPVFTAVTSTFGITAPELSVTSPEMSPVMVCAHPELVIVSSTPRNKPANRSTVRVWYMKPPRSIRTPKLLVRRSLFSRRDDYQEVFY